MQPFATREPRFSFGRNWQSFRAHALDDERVRQARADLVALAGPVGGATFLDVGSGSGLMSLAAIREGAARVVSFDVDPDSVACTAKLRDGASPDERARWEVLEGSALDERFVRGLGAFDVVYAWGVLHHTGDMWRAVENVLAPARDRLVLALYNRVRGELGTLSSESWRAIKRAYASGGRVRRGAMLATYLGWRLSIPLTKLRNPLRDVFAYRGSRGMSYVHDAIDWLGGYPYEFASADEVESIVHARGFRTVRALPSPFGGWGNNQFLFQRAAS